MQSGRIAVLTAKEKAENVAASAKSGMEKTKATAQEKVDKTRAHEPAEKAAAEELKERRMHEAEVNKQAMEEENAADREERGGGTSKIVQEHHHSTGDTIHKSPVVGERDVDTAAATGDLEHHPKE